MEEEMFVLCLNHTWDLVSCPPGKHAVGSRWIYTGKAHPDGIVDCPKARLVAKGYTLIYGLEFFDTFSHVAKLTSVKIHVALTTTF